MTKQIEDYPELDFIVTKDVCVSDDSGTAHKYLGDAILVEDLLPVYEQLQKTVDALKLQNLKLIEVTRSSEFKNQKWIEAEVERLTEQNKELKNISNYQGASANLIDSVAQTKIAQLEQEVKELKVIKDVLNNACMPWGFVFKTESEQAMQESICELLSIERAVARDPSVCKAMRDYLAQHDKELISCLVDRIINCREIVLSQGDKDTIELIAKQLQEQE